MTRQFYGCVTVKQFIKHASENLQCNLFMPEGVLTFSVLNYVPPAIKSEMFLSHPSNFWRLAWLCLATTLLAAATACKSDYPASGKAASADGKAQPRQVKTVKVAEMPIGETVTVNGNLAAFDQTTVGMKVPGRLLTINVDLGSVVRKGQVIAQLEQQDYKLRVQHAEAAIAQARARLSMSP